MNHPSIDWREWDFSGCSNDLLEVCFFWEFSRAHAPISKKFAASKQGLVIESFDERFASELGPSDKFHLPKKPTEIGPDYSFAPFQTFLILESSPEWPTSPSLSVCSQKLRKRLAKVVEQFESLPPVFTPFQNLFYAVEDDKFDLSETLKRKDTPIEYAAFELDWRLGHRVIGKAIQQWLRINKPTDVEIHRMEKGAGSTVRQRKAALHALGAWRLLKQFKLSWSHASDLTGSRLSRPLYGDQSAWIRAGKKAEKIIADFGR